MIPKIVTLLLWALCLINLFVAIPDPAGQILIVLLLFLVAAHSIECLVCAERVARAEGSTLWHFVCLFIFGYFYAVELPR